jgi:hypothetical protein
MAQGLRNVVVKLKRHQRGPVMAECKAIFAAPSKPEAIRRFRAWSERWQVEAERAERCLGERFLPPAALLRLSARAVEEDSHRRTRADAGLSEPGECGGDLLRA